MDPDTSPAATDAPEPSEDDILDSLVATHAAETEEPAETPAPAAEPAAAQTPQEPAEPPPEDRGLAVLAERQRAIRAEQEALRVQREQWQAEQAQTRAELERFQAFQRKLKRNDAYGALTDMGIKFDDLAQAVLNGTGLNPTSELEETMTARLTEAEQRIQSQLQTLEQAEQRRLEHAFRDEVTRRASTVSPVVAALGTPGVQAVYHRFAIAGHQGESLPSYEDAIRDVEKETLDFLRPLLALPAVQALVPGSRQTQAPQDASPTLRNQQAATAPTTVTTEPTFDPEDDESYIEHLARKYG